MNKLIIPLLLPGDEPILAGRLSGKRAFLKVLEGIPPLSTPTLALLDFAGVEIATSSYLSEAILPLRDHLRTRDSPVYIVVANLSDKVAEEIDGLLNRLGDALIACKAAGDGAISDAHIIGKLEPKLRETFELIREKGEATAVELHAESHDSDVGPTAWNNRLNALTSKSLVMEIPQGRTKKYRTVVEVHNGT